MNAAKFLTIIAAVLALAACDHRPRWKVTHRHADGTRDVYLTEQIWSSQNGSVVFDRNGHRFTVTGDVTLERVQP